MAKIVDGTKSNIDFAKEPRGTKYRFSTNDDAAMESLSSMIEKFHGGQIQPVYNNGKLEFMDFLIPTPDA